MLLPALILVFAESRPIRCYHKLASDPAEEEAELLFCRYTDDICVYAWLRHEDGEGGQQEHMMTIVWRHNTGLHHASQYCANSTEQEWWRGDEEPCRYGNEGGYQCGCSMSG